MIVKKCKGCGMLFKTKRKEQLYCSRDCYLNGKIKKKDSKPKGTLDQMSAEDLLHYGKISTQRQIEKLRAQGGVSN